MSAMSEPPLTDCLACPKCLVATGNCRKSSCGFACARACAYGAVKDAGGRASIDTGRCVSCMECVAACPYDAIDKAELTAEGGRLACGVCKREYVLRDGVYDMSVVDPAAPKELYDFYMNGEYEARHGSELHRDVDRKLKDITAFLPAGMRFKTLLDMGCGPGLFSRELSKKTGSGRRIFVDLSPIQLSRHPRDPRDLLVVADAAYLPLHNNTADLALLIDVLEHVPGPRRVLLEQARVSAHVLVKSPLERAFLRSLLHDTLQLLYGRTYWKRIFGHIQRFNRRGLKGLLESCGFRVLPGGERISADVADSITSPLFRAFLAIQYAAYRILPEPAFVSVFGGHLWLLGRNGKPKP